MPEATEFEFKLADGSVVKGADMAEGFKTLAKMKEDTAAALKAAREEQASLQARLEAMQLQIQQQQTPPPVSGNGFDKTKYYALLNEDPVAAQNMVDAYRFGIEDPSQVPQYFQGISQDVSEVKQNMLAASFTAMHDDFPGGEEASIALTKEVIRLRNEGHPVNMTTMNAAWKNCVDNGLVKPLTAREQNLDEELPPSLPGGAGASIPDSEIAKAENLSDKELEAFLRSKGMIR